jgi:hypothetical protein
MIFRQCGLGMMVILEEWDLSPCTRLSRSRLYAILSFTSIWLWSTPFGMDARAREIWPNAIWCTGCDRFMENPNFQLLLDAARLLKPILGELVFVGGCTTALLITDKAAADVRPTFDVDAIAEITSYAGYAQFSERA